MPGFYLTPDAQSDLIGIRRFTLQEWGIGQSQEYLSGIQQTLHLLSETPSLGKARPDVGQGVHCFPYRSHVIYYMTHEQNLVVIGVLHKRMVPSNHLLDRKGFEE